MKVVQVKVIPNSGRSEIIQTENGLKIYLKSLPIEGRANDELIKLLSKYYKVKRMQIEIISGKKSKEKLVKINES